jgi:hypothetical protein
MNVIDPAVEARRQADELRRKVYPDLYKDEADANTEGTQDEGNQQDQTQTDEATPDEGGRQESMAQKQDDPNSETWEQRWRTLNGKYNAEVPRLNEQVISLQQQVGRLMEQLSETRTTSPPANTDSKDLTGALSELQEEYGERFVNAIRSIVRSEGEELVKPVRDDMDSTTKQLGQINFYGELDRAASSWRQLNEDSKFLSWLQTSDPVSGIKYHDVLLSHFEHGDVAKTAAVFKYYTDNVQQVKAAPRTPEHLVAPKKTGGGTQSIVDNNSGDVMSMAAYEQLQRDYIQGVYKGKEQEFRNKKQSFLKAAQEGRLI